MSSFLFSIKPLFLLEAKVLSISLDSSNPISKETYLETKKYQVNRKMNHKKLSKK